MDELRAVVERVIEGGVPLQDLADGCRVSKSTIKSVLKGNEPAGHNIAKICRALDVWDVYERWANDRTRRECDEAARVPPFDHPAFTPDRVYGVFLDLAKALGYDESSISDHPSREVIFVEAVQMVVSGELDANPNLAWMRALVRLRRKGVA